MVDTALAPPTFGSMIVAMLISAVSFCLPAFARA
jgi:hypothetical protein